MILFSTIGLNPVEQVEPFDSGIGGEINTVQRTVLMEDFTNEGCMPCATFNPEWTHAIENRSDVTAPAYVHVHWPSRYDNWNNYKDMATQADNRRSLYGLSGVPSAWMDGQSTSTAQNQAYYEARIDTFAAVPANVQITSSGYVNPVTRFGTISVHAEAVENLPPGDYRLMIYFWETNVTRYQPYPNGELKMDWAVWLMLPDAKGQAIWQSGATAGDYVDVDRSFTCGSDWNLSEIGATIFVQNFDTLFVEQAHEEDFKGTSQPGNDLAVFGENVQVSYELGEPTSIDYRVFNAGTNDETNVEVNLTLDGIVQDTQTIPSLLSDTNQSSNFLWSAPSTAGVYQLGVEVSAVSGETILGNNKWDTYIEVFEWPELTAAPASFNVTVSAGDVGFDNLTIDNSGDADLNYGVGFDTQVETFSQTQWSLRNNQMDYGNVYNVTTNTTLYEINQYYEGESNNEMYFFVYEGTGVLGNYNKIAEKYIAKSGTGARFYSSGYMNVELTAGNYYYIGAAWNGNSTLWYRCSTTNQPKHSATSFGFVECGTVRQTGWPPTATMNNAYDLYVNYQSITTGSAPPAWLSVVPDSGTVGTPGQIDSTLTFDASGLTPGFYHTDMTVFSNDQDEARTPTPVDLNVTAAATTFNMSVQTGWNFISTPFIPFDTTVPDALLDVDGDTTWTLLQHYNASDAADPWKTYATYKPPGLNDLTDVNETMGVWLFIPNAAALGDGIINVSGSPPPADPIILLKAGWNMVGYPSLSPQLAISANLPGAVDMMCVFDPGQPYLIRDTADFSTVMLSPGSAYWIHANADAIWTIPTPDNPPVSQCTYSGASPTGVNPVIIDWTATDDQGLTQVELFYQFDGGGYVSWTDGTNPASASGTSDSGLWAFDFPDGSGTYDLYTIATDNSPQVENAPATPDVTIDYVFTDNPPTSLVTYSGASPTNTTPVTLDWTANDDVGLDQVELFYRFDGGPLTSWSDASNPAPAAGTADSGTWAFDFPDGYGTYDLLSIARDTLLQLEVKVVPDVTIVYQEFAGSWWNTNWDNRKKLTFDNLGQAEELIDFPVLVRLNSTNFDYAKAKADGTDLRFIDVDGSTELNYHIELWDVLADSYVWVNVTQIDGGSATDYIWMYYNYSGAANAQNVQQTYNDGYTGIWHLNETSGPHYDSTSYGQSGTPNIDGAGTQDAVGMMGGADLFDGIDDYVAFTDTTTHDTDLDQLTLEAWIYGNSFPNYASMVSKWHRFGTTADSYRLMFANGNVEFDVQESANGRASVLGGPLSTGTWYYLVGTWNNTKAVLYVNGNEVNNQDLAGTNVDDTSNGLAIARLNSNEDYYYFDGTIDEVRLSKVSRSADWITAQYLSMKGMFITFDPEETQSKSTSEILDGIDSGQTSEFGILYDLG